MKTHLSVEDLHKHTTKSYSSSIIVSLERLYVSVELKQTKSICKNAYGYNSERIHLLRYVNVNEAIEGLEDLMKRDMRGHVQKSCKRKIEIIKKASV